MDDTRSLIGGVISLYLALAFYVSLNGVPWRRRRRSRNGSANEP